MSLRHGMPIVEVASVQMAEARRGPTMISRLLCVACNKLGRVAYFPLALSTAGSSRPPRPLAAFSVPPEVAHCDLCGRCDIETSLSASSVYGPRTTPRAVFVNSKYFFTDFGYTGL